jgi:glycosyltransferase 2 family protein
LRKYLHLIGTLIAIFGVIFLIFRLRFLANNYELFSIDFRLLVILLALSILYGTANIFLVLAWRGILLKFNHHVTLLWAISTYGRSQLAKYIPGNIFQFVGRQALGMSAGLEASSLAKSMVIELVLLSFAGICFGCLILPSLMPSFGICNALLLMLVMVSCVSYLINLNFGKIILLSFLYQLFFLVISGSVFLILLLDQSSLANIDLTFYMIVLSIYVIAWLIGLYTPGAPAGMGVREVALIFMLGVLFSENEILNAVVLVRLVNITGDFLFFLVASLIPSKFIRD